MPLADVSFGEALLAVLAIALFVVWIWILFAIITDLFRNHEMSGWGKGLWIFFLIFLPFVTALIYLISHGGEMREREIKASAEAKSELDSYIRTQAHTSAADELHKLNELKEKGALSPEEFERAKSKLLG